MEKIFSERDREIMSIAADFRWRDDNHYMTLGVTPNLTAEVYSDWLDKIFPPKSA